MHKQFYSHIHTYIHVCIYAYIHTYITHVCTCVMYVCIFTIGKFMLVQTYSRSYTHLSMDAFELEWVHICIYELQQYHLCAHIDILTHTDTNLCMRTHLCMERQRFFIHTSVFMHTYSNICRELQRNGMLSQIWRARKPRSKNCRKNGEI
jgi:hypothetical protein